MQDKVIGMGLTFDDVLLMPQKSEVLPHQVNLQTRLTNNISLKLPLVSAAMDTVTESEMAITLAREGGIGIIHRNLTVEQQSGEVLKVKRSESGIIRDPVCLGPDNTVDDAINAMGKHKISGIPIVDKGKLVGILTHRDIRFHPFGIQPIKELMTHQKLITAPEGTTMDEAETILQNNRIEKLPVVDKNGALKGLITFKDVQNRGKYPNANKDFDGRLIAGAAVGVSSNTMERVEALVKAEVDVIIVDTAHGHSAGVIRTVKAVREAFPTLQLIAGNIATGEAAIALKDAGVDAVKVGIGPGSICTTRVIAGVGVPQLTAVMNVVKALNGKIPVIADGGVRYSGDIAKAIAAGADSVMIGSLFAGCKESPGEMVLFEGRSYKIFRGMGSLEAMKEGSKDRYFQEGVEDAGKLVPEGITGRVPYKGEVSQAIYQMAGGLRASMGYCGVKDIAEMQKDTRFVQITSAGVKESHPHDVVLIQEAPNYQVNM